MRIIEIDQNSGFCFGVVNAIQSAEKELENNSELYCLGDIVHNSQEVARLQQKGLITIDHAKLKQMHGKKVLLRAHGEPPSTYGFAQQNDITIIDATCRVVLQLQKKIRKIYLSSGPEQSQIVIFGKIGHAEVNGLVGQIEGNALVIEKKADLEQLDYTKNIDLFSQTTMSVDDFKEIVAEIQSRVKEGVVFRFYDTICRQVANRIPNIRKFATEHDLVLFVAGKKSSNGKVLLEECKKANANTHLISGTEDIQPVWLQDVDSVGICGATSTPKWLMEDVKSALQVIFSKIAD
ncbi:4-hydroxy-3-methylbut-2-enyl diphosphate reductase [Bacteroidia bacterium]|nr:4-hydroxy-3-methylbut-2-enyl diphosphate reductase [Bacteroidia bacterium]GHU73489.1 4-hydroxy-3-methylbut-2-enyl diphosphate reductase [Bacteroidia bacterium]